MRRPRRRWKTCCETTTASPLNSQTPHMSARYIAPLTRHPHAADMHGQPAASRFENGTHSQVRVHFGFRDGEERRTPNLGATIPITLEQVGLGCCASVPSSAVPPDQRYLAWIFPQARQAPATSCVSLGLAALAVQPCAASAQRGFRGASVNGKAQDSAHRVPFRYGRPTAGMARTVAALWPIQVNSGHNVSIMLEKKVRATHAAAQLRPQPMQSVTCCRT